MTDRKPRSILLVDDDRENLRTCTEILEQAGYGVTAVDSAAAALAALRDGLHVDAVVTDYRMPDMNGVGLLEILRREQPSIPVIMITAHADINTYFRSFSLGLFEYINKPFNEHELIRVIRVAVGDDPQGERHRTERH